MLLWQFCYHASQNITELIMHVILIFPLYVLTLTHIFYTVTCMEEFPRKSQVKGEVGDIRPQRVLCFQKSLKKKNVKH